MCICLCVLIYLKVNFVLHWMILGISDCVIVVIVLKVSESQGKTQC